MEIGNDGVGNRDQGLTFAGLVVLTGGNFDANKAWFTTCCEGNDFAVLIGYGAITFKDFPVEANVALYEATGLIPGNRADVFFINFRRRLQDWSDTEAPSYQKLVWAAVCAGCLSGFIIWCFTADG